MSHRRQHRVAGREPMNAIPTVYAGVQMRSRLEATWAAFFDQMGWKWSYEPVDLDGWIPDFVLDVDWHWAEARTEMLECSRGYEECPVCHLETAIRLAEPHSSRVFVEVKPVWGRDESAAKAAFADMRRNRIRRGLLLGIEPQGQIIGWFSTGDELVAGYIGKREGCSRPESFDLAKGDSDWGDALCHGWWCDPVNNESGYADEPPASEQLAALWAQAKNEAQWHKPRLRSRP